MNAAALDQLHPSDNHALRASRESQYMGALQFLADYSRSIIGEASLVLGSIKTYRHGIVW